MRRQTRGTQAVPGTACMQLGQRRARSKLLSFFLTLFRTGEIARKAGAYHVPLRLPACAYACRSGVCAEMTAAVTDRLQSVGGKGKGGATERSVVVLVGTGREGEGTH